MRKPTITFVYAEQYDLANDQVIIQDINGNMVQIDIQSAARMSELIQLNTKKHTVYSNVTGLTLGQAWELS